ncbi:uncharacterized protein LOC119081845 [Bradysia coprophila]|uniref:uncharacterized protein LOC119081845 n=1 Tax=Bradysia coprophila TaxID=38358 RepID=UPI00187DD024|nr:uncharacterized protein LOC119081845 [Bradysia coprophila]
MMLHTSFLWLFVASVSSTKIVPAYPPSGGVGGGGGDGLRYELPPFGSETTCYAEPCFTFPSEPICTLPKNLCGGAYTFENSCYLSFYNCEHPSNEYYEYRAGECYPQNVV